MNQIVFKYFAIIAKLLQLNHIVGDSELKLMFCLSVPSMTGQKEFKQLEPGRMMKLLQVAKAEIGSRILEGRVVCYIASLIFYVFQTGVWKILPNQIILNLFV